MRMIGHQGDFLAVRDADSKPALWAPRNLNWFAIQFLGLLRGVYVEIEAKASKKCK